MQQLQQNQPQSASSQDEGSKVMGVQQGEEKKEDNNNANNNDRFNVEWKNMSMRRQCGCNMCRSGEATTHNDSSHDQALDQRIPFLDKIFHIVGGTTKCARTMSSYLESRQEEFAGKTVLELGAGTGLVGLCLAMLGAKVLATDQEPMLEILQANIDENSFVWNKEEARSADDTSTAKYPITTMVLHWEDDEDARKCQASFLKCGSQQDGEGKEKGHDDGNGNDGNGSDNEEPRFDFVVGSDLTYSKECMSPLVRVYNNFCVTPKTVGYLLNIMRFKWEYDFFEEIAETMDVTMVWEREDIRLFKFVRKQQSSGSGAAAQAK